MNRTPLCSTALTRLLVLLALLLVALAPARGAAAQPLPISLTVPTASDLITAETTRLLAADGAMGDGFGLSVAVSGDTVVVAAYQDDDKGTDSGSVYVFHRHKGGANNWGQVKKLTADDGAAGDSFGYRVAIDGDTIVVGANGDDNGRGSAFVFYRNQGGDNNWGQVMKLVADDGAAGDHFGMTVGISGDTIVVGAPDDDDKGINSGSAYLYYRNQGGTNKWGQVKKLTPDDGAAGDRFAYSVALSGDTLVTGVIDDDDRGSGAGAAYVWERSEGGADNWGQIRKLLAADGVAGDMFGWFVTVNGDTAIVGAPQGLGVGPGYAYTYYRNQGGADNWGQVKKLAAIDGAPDDSFGGSVSVSGDTVIVGANWDDDMGSGSGSAYRFERSEGGADNWGQAGKLTAADGAAGDQFGYAIALDGDVIAIGAYRDDNERGNDAGAAYVIAPDILEWVIYMPLVRVWDMWVPW